MAFCIVKYSETFHDQILYVWEQSVFATHTFLSEKDFQAIKQIVASMDFREIELYCLLESETVIGFIGISNQKIEMLFLLPEKTGKGLGKQLVEFAVHKLYATKVDVNEQNTNAVSFYTNYGFVVTERSETDDSGFEYPLLRMQLPEK